MRALPLLAAPPVIARAPSTPPRSVRLSLTDRCDLACVYCRPHRHDGYLERRLDMPAWSTLLEGLARAGVRRVRLTGGEPLLHRDVVAFVAAVAQVKAIEDLALTTNATRLRELAVPLKRAGLHRLNVSLDTLDPARFARLTRGGDLGSVLAGIEAARDAGFEEIKLNVVVLRGENEHELAAITSWAWERGMVPRFLELMTIGEGANLADALVPMAEMQARLAPLLAPAGQPTREPDRGPARYLEARHDPRLRVGFISGTTDTYCKGCDRLRVSSDGMLRPCLATNDGTSAEGAARAGDVDAVVRAIDAAWLMKPDGEVFRGCTEDSAAGVSIRAIGG